MVLGAEGTALGGSSVERWAMLGNATLGCRHAARQDLVARA